MNLLHHHISTGNFSHAYLLAGNFDATRNAAFEAARKIFNLEAELPKEVEGSASKLETHPDFFYHQYETFGIDDSHEICQRAAQKSLLGTSKVFIMEISSLSADSSNALLKTFEEPAANTHFFIIVSSKDEIIPTLLSRFTVVEFESSGEILSEEALALCKKFLADLPNQRIDMVKKIAEDKQDALVFLNGLEVCLADSQGQESLVKSEVSEILQNLTPANIKNLENLQKCREFLYHPGSSAKMVLEHLALTLPKV